MSLLTDLEERLKAGGWTLLRKSKHQIWLHPVTQQTMPIPLRPKDTPRRRANFMSTIERYERTSRAELLDNAKESAPQPPPSSKAVVKVDLTAVAKRTSRIVQETTEAINDAFELHSTQHKKPLSFEDYLAFYKMQRDNGASWGTMFGNIRNKAKIGRAELAKGVGHRWTPATIRLLEDNKLSGLPEDELVCLAVALGAPEKALDALIESGWIPRLTTSTVPSTPAKPSTEPVEGVPAQDSTPEPTSAVPPTIQEVSMPYPKKKPGKEKVHKGGWFCPPGAALKKLRSWGGWYFFMRATLYLRRII